MFSRIHRSLAVLALCALAACSGGTPGGSVVPNPPNNVPSAGLTQQDYVGVGDSLTAGEQSNGLLGDPTATSSVSALPGGAVPPTQENGFFALFYQQATGNSAAGVLPLIKSPGLLSQLVVSTQPPGFVATHSECDTFNVAAYSPATWTATRMNPSAAIADLGVPGITMHEAVAMTGPLSGPPTGPNCGFVTIPGDPTSGGLQSLVNAETVTFLPVLGQFRSTLPAGSTTQLNAAVSLHPKLTTVWLGANDVLKYIFSHGTAPATDSPQQFAADLTKIITTLQASGSKVVVANLPHILGVPGVEGPLPQFFPIAKLSFDLQGLGVPSAVANNVQAYVQATYTGSGGFLTETGFFTVLTEISQGAPAINLDPNGAGSGAGTLYLDTTFAAQASGLIDAYNTATATVASQTGAALVDVATAFDGLAKNGLPLAPGVTLTMQFGGGLLSYDGLHPSNVGYALLANMFIGTADAAYGLSIPPLSNAQIGTIAQTDTYNPFVIKAVNPAWPYPLP
ncbi:MAG TPA: SGNH/GDSL hydrolase family protein [Candidatus Baltobacteraceae bacterium]|nr:SGNH/GDSL hydrolase family protein [Candidatus Baltobacteraceae bacterium]